MQYKKNLIIFFQNGSRKCINECIYIVYIQIKIELKMDHFIDFVFAIYSLYSAFQLRLDVIFNFT